MTGRRQLGTAQQGRHSLTIEPGQAPLEQCMQLHCTPPACSLGSKRRRRRRIRRSYLRRHRTELELRSFYCAHRLRSLASTLGRTASCISRTALHHAARLAALLKCIGDSDRRHGCAPINRVAPVYSTTGHMTYPQAVHVRCTRWPNITLATRSAWAGRAGAGPDGTSRSIGRPRGTIGRREAGKFERARPGKEARTEHHWTLRR